MRGSKAVVVGAMLCGAVACGHTVAGTGQPAALPATATELSPTTSTTPELETTDIAPDVVVPARPREVPESTRVPEAPPSTTSEETPAQLMLAPGEERELAWSFPPNPDGWEFSMPAIGTIQFQQASSRCRITLDQPMYPEPRDQATVVDSYLAVATSQMELTGVGTTAADPLRPRLFGGSQFLELPGVVLTSDTAVGSVHAVVAGRYALVAIVMCPVVSADVFTDDAGPLLQSFGASVL